MTKAVFLIHGYATNVDDFLHIMEKVKEKYDYVACDNLPGHDEVGLKNFGVEETFAYVDKTYDYLIKNFDVVDVIGYSMGGALATYITSKGGINKTVLLAPANAFLNLKLPFSRIKKSAEFFVGKFLAKDEEQKALIEQRKKNLKSDDKISMNMALKKLAPNYNVHSIRIFMKIIKRCNKNLKANNTPTLLAWGEVDQLVPKKTIRLVKKYFSNIHLVIFPTISHLMLKSTSHELIEKELWQFLDDESINDHLVVDLKDNPFLKQPTIEDEKIKLLPLKKGYVDELSEIYVNTDKKGIVNYIKEWRDHYDEGNGMCWIIYLDNQFYIGTIGFIEDEYATITIKLKTEYEQDYIWEALLAIIGNQFYSFVESKKMVIKTQNSMLIDLLMERGYELQNDYYFKEIGIEVGDKVKECILEDSEGIIRDTKNYLGKKVIIYFYSQDFSEKCIKQALGYKDCFEELKENNCIVMGVSRDNSGSHKQFKEKYEIPFILLSDENMEAAKYFGIYKEWLLFEQKLIKTVRTTFLLDEKGRLERRFDNTNPDNDAREVLNYLKEQKSAQ